MARISGTGRLQKKVLKVLGDGSPRTTREVASAMFGRVTRPRTTSVRRTLYTMARLGKVVAETGVRPRMWTIAEIPKSKKRRRGRLDGPDQSNFDDLL